MSDDWHEDPEDVSPRLEGNDTCVVCGHSFDSDEHQNNCINTPQAQSEPECDWPGEHVEDLEPYEKWDLIAWPKKGFTSSTEWDQLFERMRTPHLDGVPMEQGYVLHVSERWLKVAKCKPSRIGSPRMIPRYRRHPVTVQKEDVVAKKQREYNPRYQQKLKEKREQEKRVYAKRKWRELGALKRFYLWATGSKKYWIQDRKEEYDEEK